ncbi:MAG: cytochrome c oxidase subunit 3 [Desertimonas sp.]
MQALPAAPAPPPRRQLFVGTAIAGLATIMLIGGMLAVWYQQRARALDAGPQATWLPDGIVIPEVAANTMIFGLVGVVLFAQWAHYAARRAQRANTALALGLVALMTFAVINAQAYVWNQVHLPIEGDTAGYAGMFYAVTGTMTALFVIGLVFTVVTAFRSLGGRLADTEVTAAHALYWYVLTIAYLAVWLVVYVTK